MDIAIIGAGGGVGRQIVQMIISERIIEREQRLVLVGNETGASSQSVLGLAVDLRDAYAEVCPQIEVVFDPCDVKADLIVMAAGATVPVTKEQGGIDRGLLARTNLPVFEKYASALAETGNGSEIVICVSNPNELAVAVFAKHLGRQRVIGMGAFLDSWRFRKEIANDLGVHRQKVHAFMTGEHGANIVPLWSSVHVFGYKEQELRQALLTIRKGHTTENFQTDCAQVREKINPLISEGHIRDAYDLIADYPPDIRTVFVPFITHYSGAKTVLGTAKATLVMLQMIALGNDALVTGQIVLDGEFHKIQSTIGVPFVIGNRGVDRIIELTITDTEQKLLIQTAEIINHKLDGLL